MPKLWIILIFVILVSGSTMAMTSFVYSDSSGKQKRYFDWLKAFAKKLSQKYRIPLEVIMCQTALETGWGKSSLLTKYNNFAGIKGNDVNMTTMEYIDGHYVQIVDGFAKFATPYDGLEAYCRLIAYADRYSDAMKYYNDPYEFVIQLKVAGYATDPLYVSKLHSMIDKYAEEINS